MAPIDIGWTGEPSTNVTSEPWNLDHAVSWSAITRTCLAEPQLVIIESWDLAKGRAMFGKQCILLQSQNFPHHIFCQLIEYLLFNLTMYALIYFFKKINTLHSLNKFSPSVVPWNLSGKAGGGHTNPHLTQRGLPRSSFSIYVLKFNLD